MAVAADIIHIPSMNTSLGLGHILFQHQAFAIALDLEAGAGNQVQGVAELLGDDDAAGFVDLDNGRHDGILP